jgi:hypothetical protein
LTIFVIVSSSCVSLFGNNKLAGTFWEGFYEIKDSYYSAVGLYFLSNEYVRVGQYERTGYSASFGYDYAYSLNGNNIVIEAENDISVTMNGVIHGIISDDEIILNNFKGDKVLEKLSIEEGEAAITLKKQNGYNRLKTTQWEGKYTYEDTIYGNVDRTISLIFWLNNIVCLETFQTVYYDNGWAVGIYLNPIFATYTFKNNNIIININETEIPGMVTGSLYGTLKNNEMILK